MRNQRCISAFLSNLYRIYGIKSECRAKSAALPAANESEIGQFLRNLSRIYGFRVE